MSLSMNGWRVLRCYLGSAWRRRESRNPFACLIEVYRRSNHAPPENTHFAVPEQHETAASIAGAARRPTPVVPVGLTRGAA